MKQNNNNETVFERRETSQMHHTVSSCSPLCSGSSWSSDGFFPQGQLFSGPHDGAQTQTFVLTSCETVAAGNHHLGQMVNHSSRGFTLNQASRNVLRRTRRLQCLASQRFGLLRVWGLYVLTRFPKFHPHTNGAKVTMWLTDCRLINLSRLHCRLHPGQREEAPVWVNERIPAQGSNSR